MCVSHAGSIPDAQALERAAANQAAALEQPGSNDEAERPRKRARYGVDTTDLPVPDTNAVRTPDNLLNVLYISPGNVCKFLNTEANMFRS